MPKGAWNAALDVVAEISQVRKRRHRMGEGLMMDDDEQYHLRREAMAQEPTKRIEMDMSSVELGQTAKGDTQIKSVKVYATQAPQCRRRGSPGGVPVAQG